jgi:hypothetical protein
MAKAVHSDFWSDEGEGFGNGCIQGLQGTGFEFAQMLFDDRPAGLDGIEVRRVGWKVEEFSTGGCNQGSDAIHLMGGQIVHHHHLPGLQCRAKYLSDVGQEDIAVGGRLHRHPGLPSLDADSAQHGEGSPSPIRSTLVDSLPAWRSSVESGHVRGYAAFVQKYETCRVYAGGELNRCAVVRRGHLGRGREGAPAE